MKSGRGYFKDTQKLVPVTSKKLRANTLDKTLSSPEIRTRKVTPNFPKKLASKPAKKRGSTCKSYYLEDNAALRDSPKASNCYSELCLNIPSEEPLHSARLSPVSPNFIDRGDAAAPAHPPQCLRSSADMKKVSQGSTLSQSKELSPESNHLTRDEILLELQKAERDSMKTAQVATEMRERLTEIQKKPTMDDADAIELAATNDMLRRELARFEVITRDIQRLVGTDMSGARLRQLYKSQIHVDASPVMPTYIISQEMSQATMVNGSKYSPSDPVANVPGRGGSGHRSEPESELARRLCESYDMQEKLAADNADLESKRYILYKELVSKDQRLETYRGQIGRLQGELKMMSKENALLLERIAKNNPEGDATSTNDKNSLQGSLADCQEGGHSGDGDLQTRLIQYNVTTESLQKQLSEMEGEMRAIQAEVKGRHSCRGATGGSCFQQSKNSPPFPAQSKDCGLCPPCPASCNPNAPPTPAEREVGKLSVQLKQLEENFKTKVAECAVLRGDAVKRKEELERERCLRREIESKNREMELKYQGLATHTNMMLGTKEQALEQETSVRALKLCYREAKEEIDELRIVVKEQDVQIQDYRTKYMQAQQLVEEQRRQMDMLDMDNTRISEQINLEIQRVKLKFQEKLQELSPLPEILKATQTRLQESQQAQAIAEHNSESLARELHSCREKIHLLLHNAVKMPEKTDNKNMADEKQMQLLQSRIAQLTEMNNSLKADVERLKANVIRQEEAVLANEKRLQEKMHECAQLGGELDRARDEASRAISRAQERTDTVRKCMQTHLAELERQLAASRGQYATASKERDELRSRMQCQINRLNESFEQAQMRILGLQGQVQTMRQTGVDGVDDLPEAEPCTCRSFFA